MNGRDESDSGQIEFEAHVESDVDAPEAVVGVPRRTGAALTVLAFVFGALAVLLWINSRSSEAVDDGASLEPETSQGVVEDGIDEVTEDPVAPISPEVLPVRLLEVEVFDDQLFGLLNLTGVDVEDTPPLVVSPDGQDWADVPTALTINGASTTLNFGWSDVVTVGDELGLLGFGPNSGVVPFGSADGVDWDLLTPVQAIDSLRPFFMVAGTDNALIGLRFFDDGSTTCEGDTEPTQLGPHFRIVTIDRDSGQMVAVAQDRADLVFDFSPEPIEISDGRVAGLYFDPLGEGDRPCSTGLAPPQGDALAEFFIADINSDSAERWTVPVAFERRDLPQFLGEFATGSLRRMLFEWNGELWTFQPDLEQWNPIWIPEPDDTLDQRSLSYSLSESRSRLYALGGGQIRIWDFVDSGGFLDVVDSAIALQPSNTPRTTFQLARIMYADDDSVIFAADTIATWRVELPVELGSCERQLEQAGGAIGEVQIRCLMSG